MDPTDFARVQRFLEVHPEYDTYLELCSDHLEMMRRLRDAFRLKNKEQGHCFLTFVRSAETFASLAKSLRRDMLDDMEDIVDSYLRLQARTQRVWEEGTCIGPLRQAWVMRMLAWQYIRKTDDLFQTICAKTAHTDEDSDDQTDWNSNEQAEAFLDFVGMDSLGRFKAWTHTEALSTWAGKTAGVANATKLGEDIDATTARAPSWSSPEQPVIKVDNKGSQTSPLQDSEIQGRLPPGLHHHASPHTRLDPHPEFEGFDGPGRIVHELAERDMQAEPGARAHDDPREIWHSQSVRARAVDWLHRAREQLPRFGRQYRRPDDLHIGHRLAPLRLTVRIVRAIRDVRQSRRLPSLPAIPPVSLSPILPTTVMAMQSNMATKKPSNAA